MRRTKIRSRRQLSPRSLRLPSTPRPSRSSNRATQSRRNRGGSASTLTTSPSSRYGPTNRRGLAEGLVPQTRRTRARTRGQNEDRARTQGLALGGRRPLQRIDGRSTEHGSKPRSVPYQTGRNGGVRRRAGTLCPAPRRRSASRRGRGPRSGSGRGRTGGGHPSVRSCRVRNDGPVGPDAVVRRGRRRDMDAAQTRHLPRGVRGPRPGRDSRPRAPAARRPLLTTLSVDSKLEFRRTDAVTGERAGGPLRRDTRPRRGRGRDTSSPGRSRCARR